MLYLSNVNRKGGKQVYETPSVTDTKRKNIKVYNRI